MDLLFHTMLNWFNALRTTIKIAVFPNAMAMLQSIIDTHNLTQDYLHDQDTLKEILLVYDIEVSIRDSVFTILP